MPHNNGSICLTSSLWPRRRRSSLRPAWDRNARRPPSIGEISSLFPLLKRGASMLIPPTKFSGQVPESEKVWRKLPGSFIRNALRNRDADSRMEVSVKVLDRKKMLWLDGGPVVLPALSIVGGALVGPARLNLSQALKNMFPANPDAEILFRARLPRVLLGVAIGGGMAACGVVLQALLRNPLACPQMLGVSGGASLGGILGLIFFPACLLPFAAGLFWESPGFPSRHFSARC